MTHLLKKAFAEASKLPKEEQNILAKRLLEEFASERRWENLFCRITGFVEPACRRSR